MDSKDLLALPSSQQIAYWLGCFLVAIGNGNLKSEISSMKNFYQQEAYDRGYTKGYNAAIAATKAVNKEPS